jgi:endonuclease/exonuclease/phosphatase family metal-dependent hydrolase
LDKDAKTNVLIIGDFNDEPTNKSLHETLGAKGFSCDSFDTKQLLFNLAWFKKSQGEGTFKYRDNWNVLDQIIVSSGLMYGKIKYLCNSFDIFKPGFLVTQSGKYAGAPAPTYGGERYLGGFSDHFPVTAKFLVKKKK